MTAYEYLRQYDKDSLIKKLLSLQEHPHLYETIKTLTIYKEDIPWQKIARGVMYLSRIIERIDVEGTEGDFAKALKDKFS